MKRFFLVILFMIIFLASSCGTELDLPGDSIIAPPGSTITINPAEFTDTPDIPETYLRKDYSVIVRDSNDIPIGRVRFQISFPFAYPVTNYFRFIDGSCQSNKYVNGPYYAETDDYGVYRFCVEYLAGCYQNCGTTGALYHKYKGDITVTSGTVFGSATFEVAGPSGGTTP
ncbi:MAG: hypothetical protein N2257_06525 [Thermodesulfovibrionales bacterium]|nr:hypothetical protein [Thermodesulfovibrionales bacterium]